MDGDVVDSVSQRDRAARQADRFAAFLISVLVSGSSFLVSAVGIGLFPWDLSSAIFTALIVAAFAVALSLGVISYRRFNQWLRRHNPRIAFGVVIAGGIVTASIVVAFGELVFLRERVGSNTSHSVKPSESPIEQPALQIPLFPWPPPRASSESSIKLKAHAQPFKHLSDIDAALTVALDYAGYEERSYFSVPQGFALVTRLEQTLADGRPMEGEERWAVEPNRSPGPFSIESYLQRLLLSASPGYFRILVFVVTPVPFSQADAVVDRDAAMSWLGKGFNRLPESVGGIECSATTTYLFTALVYEFEATNSSSRIRLPGRLTARTHLQKAALLQGLE
jgi:hypothetical protein